MQEERESVGALIRRARLERGMTQRQPVSYTHLTLPTTSRV